MGLRLWPGVQVVYNILIVNRMSSELPETGSAKLIRAHMFNQREDDVDVPDGDIQYGKKLYNQLCAGCHNYIGLGPSLISIYGSKAAQQRQFTKYSNKTISMRKHRWSKQRLFTMLQNPEAMFGVQSAMTFDGLKDPYMRACIIEYMQFMRLTDPLAAKPKEYMKN